MLKYVRNELFVEKVAVSNLAKKYNTPLYIYSQDKLEANFNAYKTGFKGVDSIICYAMKANSNYAILKLLAKLGAGADIVSGGELYRALKAGINPRKIVYSGVGKTSKEIEFALKSDILMFNIESFEELEQINKIAGKLKKKARISFRVNPNVDAHTHKYITTGKEGNKFGIRYEDAFDIYMKASKMKNIEIVGVGSHIGSQILDVTPFKLAAKKISALIDKLESNGMKIKYIDIGGGLGIKYAAADKPQKPIDLRKMVMSVYSKYKDKTIIVEPGRAIVGDAGILVGEVLYRKTSGPKNFIITNLAMNDLIRPALYESYHSVIPVKKSSKKQQVADVVGPVCESGDFIAKDRTLPIFEQGEFIVAECAGAYGRAMASQYNSRPRGAEVLVKGSKVKVIRKAETIEDLMSKEIK
ncbi:diaminopimelate decarboxylase [Candidatus Ruminimicrobiellum ovillum]|uniref:diaminopimelate decarboxylase n=1 Tax=Candidatus Ruminimicrobiellum ovillum TaxID=1947927 RepID=UPI003559E5C4